MTIKVITDVTGILCTEKGWEEENGAELLIFKQLDGQEQLSIATDIRFDRQHRKEEGVYKGGPKVGL